MDDLLVIILTLIIAGVGVLGQLRKKKQTGSNPTPAEGAGGFWDLIQGGTEFIDEQEEAGYVDEEVNEPVFIERETVRREKVKNLKGPVLNDNLKSERKSSKLKSLLKEDFSLRKAVIYSEILNRKYK